MATNYGRPRGAGGETTGQGGAIGTNTGVEPSTDVAIDLSRVEAALDILNQTIADLSAASSNTTATANPEVIRNLSITTDQALLFFAGDWKGYYNLYAYGTAIIRIFGLTAAEYGTLEILGDIELGDEVELTMEQFSILNIGY